MTLLDHVVLQVDNLNAIGDWYDQFVSLAGGTRTFDMPTLIGYALPGQPAQLFFSLATDPGGRQTHLALRVEDETTVRLVHDFATALGGEILHGPRLWPEYAPDYYAVFIRDPAGNNLELKCEATTEKGTPSTQPIAPGKTVTTN
jgi:catechol 2,3-dioxygenase-like lactoylglutathione lyase family enzyme